ncbi:cutinase family protein [Rhodococcus sp. 27YEA15]|uniref:cutinase family protein n=1 Tax=Rhodococcus sp. 27YEA15 TaxID=3156259 RepID=UPI003C7A91D1
MAAAPAHARNVIVVDGTGNGGRVLQAPEIQPGDTVTQVQYPASVVRPTYDQSVAAGTVALRAALVNAPDDTLVIGYSQGARIVGDVLSEPQNARLSGVLYSDPRQFGTGVETKVVLPEALGATMTGERQKFTVPVETKCISADGVCDWRTDDPVGSIIGYLETHTTYFG